MHGRERTCAHQRRSYRDVDFLQKLQRLGVKEADGGTLGERHPHASTGTRHVCNADRRLWVDFKLLERDQPSAQSPGSKGVLHVNASRAFPPVFST